MENINMSINMVSFNMILLTLIIFCSCNRNTAEPKDCNGVEGGPAVYDDCGVCNGDGSTCSDDGGISDGGDDGSAGDDSGGDGGNSDGGNLECLPGYTLNDGISMSVCTPNLFLYNSSTQQAAYFFRDATFNAELLNEDDWVGAFNGDVCVGSRKWDTSQCGGGICDIPVLGFDGELTLGYMSAGEFPVFKIFKASDLSYYEAFPSDNKEWESFGTWVFDSISECTDGTLTCNKKRNE